MESQVYTLPFPSGGINARDPLSEMDPLDAVAMENIIPRGGYGELRSRVTSFAGVTSDCKTLSVWRATNFSSGTDKIVAGAGGKLINITAGGSGTNLGTGYSSDIWQSTQIKDTIVWVNGTDQPKKWDGATFADATYTGISDDNALIDICNYRDRLYFAEKDTYLFYYAGAGSITGALTSFSVGEYFPRGGGILFVGSLSMTNTAGPADYFVVCSNRGDCLIYQGSYPGDTTTPWQLVARLSLSTPLGRRCKKNVGGDLMVMTVDGIVSLRAALQNVSEGGKYPVITDKIRNLWQKFTRELSISALGWEMLHYPAGNLLLVNLPANTYSLDGVGLYGIWLGMNTESGAWTTFSQKVTNQPSTWVLYNDIPYFGAPAGSVIKFDDYGHYQDDAATPVFNYVQFSFNDLGIGSNKLIHMVRPYLYGDPANSFSPQCLMDYPSTDTINPTAVTGSNTFQQILKWQGVTGYGRALSLRFAANSYAAPYKLNSVDVLFEAGGNVF